MLERGEAPSIMAMIEGRFKPRVDRVCLSDRRPVVCDRGGARGRDSGVGEGCVERASPSGRKCELADEDEGPANECELKMARESGRRSMEFLKMGEMRDSPDASDRR